MNSTLMIIFILALTGTSVLIGPCILSLLVRKWRSEFPKVAIPFAVSLVTFLVLAVTNTPGNSIAGQPIDRTVPYTVADAVEDYPKVQTTIPAKEPTEELENGANVQPTVIVPGDKTGESYTVTPAPVSPTVEVIPKGDTGSTNSNEQISVSPVNSELKIYFIDVGEGDSTLIVCDGEAMIIDLAANKGSLMKKYLNDLGIKTIKYVIGTHPDEDHIGSLDVVFENYDCKTIIMPDLPVETKTHQKILDSIKWMNYRITPPVAGDTYQLGGASFTILGPQKQYSDDNNNSVTLKLTHGENTFLFTGDAEKEAEDDYIISKYDLKADVLKVGHHGSNTSTTTDFLNSVNPTYAVISCGNDNAYGHPNKETLDKLKNLGCKVFRTDEQGTIVATSDGKILTFSCNPSETWAAGVITPSESTGVSNGSRATNGSEQTNTNGNSTVAEEGNTVEPASQNAAYVLNLNTHKFHRLDCKDINKMSDKNKEYSSKTRDEIISEGYSPCQHCYP